MNAGSCGGDHLERVPSKDRKHTLVYFPHLKSREKTTLQ